MDERVSIAEAARRAGVSRRTLERWIEQGRLTAEASSHDRRVKLVNALEVGVLAAGRQTPGKPRLGESKATTEGERATGDDSTDGPNHLNTTTPDYYQEVIDQALQLVYSHHHRLISQLDPSAFHPLQLHQIREGPLGKDLSFLAQFASGQLRDVKEGVLEAIESVLQVLFWPAAADDYSVPRSFWDTELGRIMALAKYRAFDPSELVSIGNAAKQLGVTRATIYDWLDDRTLNYVHDEVSGRIFVVRRDIENLKRMARQFAAQEARREKLRKAKERMTALTTSAIEVEV